MNFLKIMSERANFCAQNFLFRFMAPSPELVTVCGSTIPLQYKIFPQNPDNFLNPSIVWVTPRRRHCVELRNTKRFGRKEWGTSKMIPMKRDIRVDHKTGEYFQVGKLAPLTYKKIMEETRLIQQKMAESFGTGTPKDKDVVVLYKGEQKEVPDKYRVIEMDHERPAFFSANLMQKTRDIKEREDSQTLKPSGLS
eukprot:TRINITY_DN3546_c0_g1_i8.p1 TRINITY_DN3546_c0_g1~~TRINITY_DN3546_c0_g1_i8.p1  ORF type:complete len:207 (-),score=26.57 TRINITY_DN3546_c0_g1_i8:217-801(-)